MSSGLGAERVGWECRLSVRCLQDSFQSLSGLTSLGFCSPEAGASRWPLRVYCPISLTIVLLCFSHPAQHGEHPTSSRVVLLRVADFRVDVGFVTGPKGWYGWVVSHGDLRPSLARSPWLGACVCRPRFPGLGGDAAVGAVAAGRWLSSRPGGGRSLP